MGKASRLKQQRRQGDEPAQGGSANGKFRTLLALMTSEPFQPIRLYFEVAGREEVLAALRTLECIGSDAAEEDCWVWLFEAESADLPIGTGYEAVPEDARPVVLGRIRFPSGRVMTLDTNSPERAVEGAGFFGGHLGQHATLVRARVVNRLFSGEESEQGGIQALMTMLDQNVTVIDPREAEARKIKELQAGPAALAAMQRKLMETGGDDVPLVEDFPLAPEEETPDFTHLQLTLMLRAIRAMERWRGNTSLTLPRLIMGLLTGQLDIPGAETLKAALQEAALSVASLG